MTTSQAAFAAVLMLGAAAPALAQSQTYQTAPPRVTPAPAPAPTATPAQPERQYNLNRAERTAMQPLLVAVQASDWPAAVAALPAAVAAARGNDAKYLIGQIRLRIGIGTSDRQMQAQGIDEMIASGGAQPHEMRALYENQLSFATAAGDTAKAARATAQLDALNPNDPNRFIRQAAIRATANDIPGALALYRQAIQLQTTNGQPIPVEWRQRMSALAYGARLPETASLMREWLAVAPSQALWHDSLAIYAEFIGASDGALTLDVYRLIRAAGAMTNERDFIVLAQAASDVRAFGEIKAVLEEGFSRNLITANAALMRERIALATRRSTEDRASLATERTAALAGRDGAAVLRLAEAYYGYGEYGPAAELYRAALQKGGTDANVVNTRLGAALAQAGQRAEAEAAFRAVTGPRTELAQYWLLWLQSRGR
jgi:Flp pilus assembly protein TadD